MQTVIVRGGRGVAAGTIRTAAAAAAANAPQGPDNRPSVCLALEPNHECIVPADCSRQKALRQLRGAYLDVGSWLGSNSKRSKRESWRKKARCQIDPLLHHQ